MEITCEADVIKKQKKSLKKKEKKPFNERSTDISLIDFFSLYCCALMWREKKIIVNLIYDTSRKRKKKTTTTNKQVESR